MISLVVCPVPAPEPASMSIVAESLPIHFRCPVPAPEPDQKKVIVVKYYYYYYTTLPRITITSSITTSTTTLTTPTTTTATTATTATTDFIDCMSGSGAGTGVDVNCRKVIANSF